MLFFSESNSTALKYFNNGNLLPILAKCLEVSVFGMDTAIVVGMKLLSFLFSYVLYKLQCWSQQFLAIEIRNDRIRNTAVG